MQINHQHLYLNVIKNHLDDHKFIELSPDEKLINSMIILYDGTFPQEMMKMNKWLKLTSKATDPKVRTISEFEMMKTRFTKTEAFKEIFLKDKKIQARAKRMVAAVVKRMHKDLDGSVVFKRAEALKTLLGITDTEIEVILALIVLRRLNRRHRELPIFEENFSYNELDRFSEPIFSRTKVAVFLGESRYSKNSMIPKDSILIKANLIDSGRGETIGISDALFTYFCEKNADISMIHSLEKKTGKVYPLESFSVDKNDIQLCSELLLSPLPAALLFVGLPGSSKTEFARAIAHSLGKEALFIPSTGSEGDDGLKLRKTALSIATLTGKDHSKVIVLDEADEVLNSSQDNLMRYLKGGVSTTKEFLNSVVLDQNQSKLIMICNHNTLDPSVLRRCSLVVKFEKLNPTQRLLMLENTLNENNAQSLLTRQEMITFSESVELTQGNIALAIRDSQTVKETFLGIINNKLNFETGKKLNLNPHEELFDPQYIKTSVSSEEIEAKLSFFMDETTTRWRPTQSTFLFTGGSGLGKTAYAGYLAKKFGRKFMSISAPSLQDKYVGGTEERIRQTFNSAEATKSFLFFDEIEALLKGRSEGDKRYELSQVNEFLLCLENFKGVCIGATNMGGILDHALKRRFNDTVNFLAPDLNSRVGLVSKYFTDQVNFDMHELESGLLTLEGLTPGQVKAVKQSLAYRESFTLDFLLGELKKSMGKVSAPVGLI